MAIDPIMLALMRRGGGAGVQPDYAQNDPNAADYIKNRPGGYYDGFDITWDGEIGDRLVVLINDDGKQQQFVKVSDRWFTDEELIGSVVTARLSIDDRDEVVVVTKKDIIRYPGGVTDVLPGSVFVVTTKSDQHPFPETGTYFHKDEELFIRSISKTAKVVKIPAELTTMAGGYIREGNNGAELLTITSRDLYFAPEQNTNRASAVVSLKMPLALGDYIRGSVGPDRPVNSLVREQDGLLYCELYENSNFQLTLVQLSDGTSALIKAPGYIETFLNISLDISWDEQRVLLPVEYLDITQVRIDSTIYDASVNGTMLVLTSQEPT